MMKCSIRTVMSAWLWLLIVAIPSEIYGGGRYAGVESIVAEVEGVLISHGICESEVDCTRKAVLKFSDIKDGVRISLYNVTEPSVVKEVVDSLSQSYFEREGAISIFFEVFPYSHAEKRARWFWEQNVIYSVCMEKGGIDRAKR